ncbi:Glycosyltransferase involved in cell wall bisynthesis [Reichenbachiella faecimaris]|uniref:Glycosyltransferase involved in cell wall bisynthesis n=1 Tax=Reichenbachiella faecimaris TaxID=692418 RepID=A0A1W2G8Q5_REIFA|nr:glycosyltransferase family 1 protein [Reichenbachiella faecimaris]SMD32981.1 Glycosyltransferase involved in cell wall bisynthesis [Reichenbachiella faecimaris]
MRKIAIFADVLEENFDGVSVTLHKILQAIPEDQFNVLVITSHPPRDINSFRHKIHLTPYLNLPFQKGYRLGLPNGKKLQGVLDQFSPDLIHFTSPSLFGKFAIKYARKNDLPVMNIYHTHYPVYLKYYIGRLGDYLIGSIVKKMLMWYYKNSDLTLTPTRTIKKDLIKLSVPAGKLKVWGRALKIENFSPAFRDESLFDLVIPHENKKILFVSRLIKEKEMKTLYKVYKKLRKADQTITMIITGDGPKRDWLENKMPKAVFTGKKVGPELSKIYASCDLFFFPSESETFGNVIIEAMASGLPIVAANAGGPSELIKNNKTGFLIKPRKIKKFSDQIIGVLRNDSLREQISGDALNFVKSRTIENLHTQLWGIYNNLIYKHQAAKTNQLIVRQIPKLSTSVDNSEISTPAVCK